MSGDDAAKGSFRASGGRQHRPSADRRTACTAVRATVIGFIHMEAVVEEELFAGEHVSQRIEDDHRSSARSALFIGHTVRCTGVVDVPRCIPAIGCINDTAIRQPEHIGEPVVPVAAAHLMRGVATALVDAEALAFLKILRRECALAVDTALTDLDHEGGNTRLFEE